MYCSMPIYIVFECAYMSKWAGNNMDILLLFVIGL